MDDRNLGKVVIGLVYPKAFKTLAATGEQLFKNA
jgi:hypothetical protein